LLRFLKFANSRKVGHTAKCSRVAAGMMADQTGQCSLTRELNSGTLTRMLFWVIMFN
jgi:hypothetical protein